MSARRRKLSIGLFGAVLLVLGVMVGARVARGLEGPPLPVLATLPAFELTAHDGSPFGQAQMRGRVWVVDFVYTGCSAICPKLTARMSELQGLLLEADPEGRVGLLSITVDPEGDTPERLAAYASRAEARDGRWIFLTGEASAVQATVVRGFKMAMGEDPSAAEEGFAIVHGGKLALVDAEGRIRGYFEPENVKHTARPALRLAA